MVDSTFSPLSDTKCMRQQPEIGLKSYTIGSGARLCWEAVMPESKPKSTQLTGTILVIVDERDSTK